MVNTVWPAEPDQDSVPVLHGDIDPAAPLYQRRIDAERHDLGTDMRQLLLLPLSCTPPVFRRHMLLVLRKINLEMIFDA